MILVHKGKNIFGISTGFISNSFEFTLAVSQSMGDFYKLTIPGYDIFVISRADLVKHILSENNEKYIKGHIYWKKLSQITGNGIATSEGVSWLERRRFMQPFFSQFQIRHFVSDMGRIVARYFDQMHEIGRDKSVRDVFIMGNEITAEITFNCILGLELPIDRSELHKIINRSKEFLLYCAKYPWNETMARFNGRKRLFDRGLKYFDKIIYDYIRQKRKTPQPVSDMLTAMAQRKDKYQEFYYSDRQLRDEFITLLGGGSENSSACFSWTIFLLWKHTEVLQRLRTEIDSLLGIEEFVDDSINLKLSYTEKVIRESLRLYPPGYAIIREASENDVINGNLIKKGSTVYIPVHVLHRHKGYWKDPDEFRPERFDVHESDSPVRYAYIPFGAGPHACIGMHMAIAELKVMLATLVRRFEFSLERDDALKIMSGITPIPEGGLPFRFKRRLI